jgi:SAM-dependent MidA family methyltransferase
MTDAATRIRALVSRQGPVPWSVVLEAALYGPAGFYTGGGGAGRQRDFLTSPEVGPLFGAVVAGAVDAAWVRWGRPDPWVVVEAGAGAGSLAASVLAAGPACAAALRYIAVERSPALRAAAADLLPVEDPAQILGPRMGQAPDPGDEDPADGPAWAAGVGPLVTVVADLPAVEVNGLVIANELLDNLAFDLYRRRGGTWHEVRVGLDGTGLDGTGLGGSGLAELEVPASAERVTRLDALVPDPPEGCLVPWESGALGWLRRALGVLTRGQLVIFDYARPTAELARLPVGAWLRTYRGGGPGGERLDGLGGQDITVDVAVDQLGLVRPPTRVEQQADWLDRHGMAALEAAAASRWRAGAARGDLQALADRSRVGEAAILRDRRGLGGFTVCEWDVGSER